MFSSVLIANRGEIACRVMRTARNLGLRTIAVYSMPDAEALHVEMADEAYPLDGITAIETYLDIDKVLTIAKKAKADCIHPGYGFLSENAAFVKACEKAAITFIGPSAKAIEAMGLKDAAKELMQKAGVPVVPGYEGANQDEKELAKQASNIGYPLLIKAVAGGGGKGMRMVETPEDFLSALQSCQREAKKAFGEDRVLLEKYLSHARHIEVQIFADGHGNAVHLCERDCSLQRRHQKVIEEAPAPGMTAALRAEMGEAAVKAALAVGYEGAGTVEFIVDASNGLQSGGFYFMEMNTRLQVEHPVTEAITGLDLVELQFRVASGEKLGISQSDVTIDGHAIEMRLYAEDPIHDFLPQSGKIIQLNWPEDHATRIDTGIRSGSEISPFYDPMIAKLIIHTKNREQTIDKSIESLKDTSIFGIRNNQSFLVRLLEHPAFQNADVHTGFIEQYHDDVLDISDYHDALMIAAWHSLKSNRQRSEHSIWDKCDGWILKGFSRTEHLSLVLNGKQMSFRIEWGEDPLLHLMWDDMIITKAASELDGAVKTCRENGFKMHVLTDACEMITVSKADLTSREDGALGGGKIITAPMSGRVIKVNVNAGDQITSGDVVLILEAMKMEHALTAEITSEVDEVRVEENTQVSEGDVLITMITPDK